MGQKKATGIHKISKHMPGEALAVIQKRLENLECLIQQGIEIDGSLQGIAAKLRQVVAMPGEPFALTRSLQENKKHLDQVFADSDDIKMRSFSAGESQALLVYVNGMADTTVLEESVLPVLMRGVTGNHQRYFLNNDQKSSASPDANSIMTITQQLLSVAEVKVLSRPTQAIEEVLTGNAILLVDGISDIIAVHCAKFPKRSVEEAKMEGGLRGSHDGFTETLTDNIVLVRRRTKDANCKVQMLKIGVRTKNMVAIIYVDNLVKKGLVEEILRRLESITVDKATTSFAIEELLVEHPWSPFPQMQSTEKPEVIASALYEGRVCILVDNTPAALLIPCTYKYVMQASDDYTQQPVIASLVRFTRHFAALLAVYLPALYTGIVSFHPAILPTSLAISIAEIRSRTPFPSIVEVAMILAMLEIFQEALVRLPQRLVSGASMVGGFVIGTTVVQAGLINPLLVVVIAVTAIASYSMVFYNFGLALRVLRVPMIILASTLGLYGVVLGMIAVTIHLSAIKNFGESYLGGFLEITLLEDWKDSVLRFPRKFLTARPKELGVQDRTRVGGGNDQ